MERKILIIDDDEEIREILCDILNEAKIPSGDTLAFVQKADGLEGFSALEKEKFDLIFTDFKMPVMDGRTLIQAIQDKENPNQQTPIVVLSGKIPEMEITSKENVFFLEKPIDSDRVQRVFQMSLLGNQK